MKIKQAIEILKKHNIWRIDNNVPPKTEMADPKELGIAIDTVVEFSEILIEAGFKFESVRDAKQYKGKLDEQMEKELEKNYDAIMINIMSLIKLVDKNKEDKKLISIFPAFKKSEVPKKLIKDLDKQGLKVTFDEKDNLIVKFKRNYK